MWSETDSDVPGLRNAEQAGKQGASVPAVERALDILEYLAKRGAAADIKQMSTDLNIPLVSTYRIVGYLVERGYLRKTAHEGKDYALGMRLVQLAQAMVGENQLIPLAAPIMQTLSQQTGQTVQLGVLEGSGVMYIHQTQPTRPVTIVAALWSILPINVSASGKLLVAYLPDAEQDALLEGLQLAPRTENTITSLPMLRSELARIRAQGYAMDHEEYARGIGCVAAPILDHRGRALAAIGTTGHIADFVDSRLTDTLELVVRATHEISARLGSQGIGLRVSTTTGRTAG